MNLLERFKKAERAARKPMLALLIAAIASTGFVSAGAEAATSLRTRAEAAYFAGRTDVHLYRLGSAVTPEEARTGILYPSRYVPVKELFGGEVDDIRWNPAAKTVSVMQGGRSAVLNFSGRAIVPGEDQVVLPATWTRMEGGRAMIDIYTLAYVLDRYGEAFDDAEREAWNRKLSFLGIASIETVPDVHGSGSSIYVTFADS